MWERRRVLVVTVLIVLGSLVRLPTMAGASLNAYPAHLKITNNFAYQIRITVTHVHDASWGSQRPDAEPPAGLQGKILDPGASVSPTFTPNENASTPSFRLNFFSISTKSDTPLVSVDLRAYYYPDSQGAVDKQFVRGYGRIVTTTPSECPGPDKIMFTFTHDNSGFPAQLSQVCGNSKAGVPSTLTLQAYATLPKKK